MVLSIFGGDPVIKVEYQPGKYFTPDFSRVIVRADKSFEYVISKDLSLSFINLFMIHEESTMYADLTEFIVNMKLFDDAARTVERKIRLFETYEEDRVRRYLTNESRTIFFDFDQVYKIDELFHKFQFLADAEILLNGAIVEMKKLTPYQQRIITDTMHELGLIYDLTPEEFRAFSSVRHARIISKRKDYQTKGVKFMTKGNLIFKGIGGAILVAIGSAVVITGIAIVERSATTLLGIQKDVILVSNDENEE